MVRTDRVLNVRSRHLTKIRLARKPLVTLGQPNYVTIKSAKLTTDHTFMKLDLAAGIDVRIRLN